MRNFQTPNQSKSIDTFYWSENKEPHFERRKKIMNAHPEVRKLVGSDPKLIFAVVGLVLLQLGIALVIGKLSTVWFLLITYIVGATAAHALFLAIHELSHDLAFRKLARNNWLALIANIPLIVPYAMSFKTYHLQHHWEQGKDGMDVDIPMIWEAKLFRGRIGKLIWAMNQILFYAFRPILVRPIKLEKWHLVNIVFQLGAMAVFLPFAGWSGFAYLILSMYIAGSLHPVAGHFISEHYVFKPGQETYSYYGPLNKVAFNVGYHNEHHDFPNIPGSRLPQLKRMASEFYDPLLSYRSWSMVIVRFIMNRDVDLFSRVKRNEQKRPSLVANKEDGVPVLVP
jgi:sphingolipid delta-4 desaturase